MRIGFDAHVFDGRDQGTKTLMLRLIEAIGRRFPEHEMFIYSERPHPELDWDQPNLHHRPTIRHNVARHLLYTLPRANRADALDTMVFNFIQSPIIRNATVMMHDILPQTHPRFFPPAFVAQCWTFFGMSALLAKHLFTISEHSREDIRRVYPWSRRKHIGVMHIGASFPEPTYFATADPAAAMPASVGTDARYILIVGRIEARKNVQMAIDAFSAGAPANVKLVIVGRREPGIVIDTRGDPRIIELSGVADADLVTLYRGAALFLYPSIAEGFGLPLLDAILFGLPVISSSRTSLREVGDGCVTFFDPTVPDAAHWLRERIADHFNEHPVPAASIMARRARAALYSWDNAAKEMIAALGAPTP